ncbi:protein mono-ADP-ribosyltransferase PARP6-like isoform X2 [Labrus mixtus]|uniref:protein mono-ADP-ribosyltransferase PARP6-like isoform X2 n=1 Tax=Labrus mixtus TaxID=508554 RepID=UPI0029BFFBC1|nr:protein mono-ADP-ribosyltransferase PARP6-like isoform X2 [Labrus mixtus]
MMVAKEMSSEHMETESEPWTESQSDEDSDVDVDSLSGSDESCATEWYHHHQLETDIEAVRTLYSDSAVSIREFGWIDDVDVDLNINTDVLDQEVAEAWRINPSEPIVIRLHFSLSEYLDGPAPSVEVFQPSNKDQFSLGKQLQNILTIFLSREWKHLTNENIVVRRKSRQSWFRRSGTIKKFRARLSIRLPPSKSDYLQESVGGRIILPPMKRNCFTNHKTSYNIKNPTGELFTYTPSGKRVAVSAVKSSAQLSTKQLIELLFSSQAIGHCKTTPTLQHGFLVQVVDLLVAMCRAALQSSRKSIIFEPYPSVVDPYNPKTLAFSPKRKSYDRLQKALDSVLLIRRMAQGPYSETKKQMDKIDPLAHPLLQWILASNRSHIVKLPLNRQLKFMQTPHQFLLISSPPSKEARFQTARKLYGSTFAFHGSHIENWHSILRNGLVNASYTKLQLHGAAYGKGIYLSPISGISFGYSEMGKGQHQMPSKEELLKRYNQLNQSKQDQPVQARFLQNRNLNCIALCEVITSKDLQKHGNIWVCPISDYVCTRFLFVYENGLVGDVQINTQEASIHREIIQVIAS